LRDADVVQALAAKLAIPTGRHLYGVIGRYPALDRFSAKLTGTKLPDGTKVERTVSVTAEVLNGMADDDFRRMVADEAKRPEVVAAEVQRAFNAFLRGVARRQRLVVLANLEIVFAYHVELNLLRTLAADDIRFLLLLPGGITNGKPMLFEEQTEARYVLPANLIAENHLWVIED
jgi:hypothetical protein